MNETRSERLKDIYDNISLLDTRNGGNSFLCGMCNSVVDNFFWMRRILQESDESLKNLAIELCIDLELQIKSSALRNFVREALLFCASVFNPKLSKSHRIFPASPRS